MIRTKGIVLSGIKYKESSKILKVYTKELGKISIMAQGVMKPKSQYLSSTEIFSISDFQLKKGKSFYYIESCDLDESNYTLRQDMDKMILGFYVMELIDKSIPDEEENNIIFDLLLKTIKVMTITENPLLVSLSFQLKFASFLGYRPVLLNCSSCDTRSSSYWEFHPDKGGIVCEACSRRSGREVSGLEISILNKLLLSTFEEISEYKINPIILTKLHGIISDYLLYNLDRKEFKSLLLLEQINHAKRPNS